jgi:2,3-dihydroxybenzoate decarboxylase
MGGVFDRFPRVKIIVGHLGENLVPIPSQVFLTRLAISSLESRPSCWKIGQKTRRGNEKDDWILFQKCLVLSYLTDDQNVYLTTSGNFSTQALLFTIDVVGVNRVLFSIDAPYEQIEEGQTWWKSLEDGKVLDEESLRKIGRENAIKLMRLPLR